MFSEINQLFECHRVELRHEIVENASIIDDENEIGSCIEATVCNLLDALVFALQPGIDIRHLVK